MTKRWLTLAAVLAVLAAGCGGGDDTQPEPTGSGPGIEEIVENPEGVHERTVDRYARYTECALAYGRDACPTPGRTDAYDHEDWAERLGLG